MIKIIALILTVALLICVYQNSHPRNIGFQNGKLMPCPSSPNCARATLPKKEVDLLKIVEQLPRTTIVTASDNYIHAECRSKIFRFIDDLEILVTDEEIHLRSASRVGYGDMGVNQKRIDQLKRAISSWD